MKTILPSDWSRLPSEENLTVKKEFFYQEKIGTEYRSVRYNSNKNGISESFYSDQLCPDGLTAGSTEGWNHQIKGTLGDASYYFRRATCKPIPNLSSILPVYFIESLSMSPGKRTSDDRVTKSAIPSSLDQLDDSETHSLSGEPTLYLESQFFMEPNPRIFFELRIYKYEEIPDSIALYDSDVERSPLYAARIETFA